MKRCRVSGEIGGMQICPYQVLTCTTFTLLSYLAITSGLPHSQQVKEMNAKVVIIGAGVSGIGAASKLMQNGVSDITILEAMDRVGGRVNYRTLGNNLGGVDLGGHWVHGQGGNIVYELAQPLGLVQPSGDYDNVLFFHPNGREQRFNLSLLFGLFYDLDSGTAEVVKSDQKLNYEEYVHNRVEEKMKSFVSSKSDLDSIKRQVSKNQCTLEACDSLKDVSVKQRHNFHECEGDRLIEWKSGGMANILDLLMGTHEKSPWKGLDVASKVRLSTRVARIDWNDSPPVRVTTECGDTLTADYVLFTPSVNVLKAKHKNMFNPALPLDKVEAIQSMGMDVVDKIYLVFDKPWWPSNVSGFSLLHEKAYPTETQDWGRDIVAFIAENHNPHVLGAWMTGAGAKEMEKDSDEQVKATCMRILREYLPSTYSIPEPALMIRSRWWNEEDVRGSYSFDHVDSDHLTKPRKTLAQPLLNKQGKPVVLFAGEVTNEIHFSTVHGALETGWREADRILDIIRSDQQTTS